MPRSDSGDYQKNCLASKIINTIRRNGWPVWDDKTTFTIILSKFLRDEAAQITSLDDPAEVLQASRNLTLKEMPASAHSAIWDGLENDFVQLVYGSNYIEQAGTTYDITVNLCRRVFRGEVIAATVGERDDEYTQGLRYLRTRKLGHVDDKVAVMQSRAEVVQHAQALEFLVARVVVENEVMSEKLIIETHRILHSNIPHNDGEDIAGRYRIDRVAARHGTTKRVEFIRPEAVPAYMSQMMADLKEEIYEAEQQGSVDPYELAARYCHRFVNIHPFADGNGRVCRIFLNVLLLKYGGHVSTFGADDEGREEYLKIARKGSWKFHEEDMEVEQRECTGHHDLARFTLCHSVRPISRMAEWCKRNKTYSSHEDQDKQ
ncbi:hypothetical protein MMC09_006745 [Bachmanniomyces sp. S44760]|nr:hypothetical protein [Bachmanniomyces sp. S44760]